MLFEPEIYPLKETAPPVEPEPFYGNYQEGVPIALDLGTYSFKIGLTNSLSPLNVFPSLISRYRDRKAQKLLTLIGNDVYRDVAFKLSIKSPFDGPLVTNWDYIEDMLDYSFEHLSVSSKNGKLNNPVILTEPPCVPLSQRKMYYELLYETYNAPKVTFGIDSLFAHYANTTSETSNSLVIGTGHELTHVIPVINGRGVLLHTKRLDWGGSESLQFLQKLLSMKYPYFPLKVSLNHSQNIFKDHCYVLLDYSNELAHYLDVDVLEKKDRVLQAPVEIVAPEKKKSEEELAKQAEKRREQGRRLQQQAKQKRAEKLLQKEKELEYYTQVKADLDAMTSKSEVDKRLAYEEFDNLSSFNKYLAGLEKALKKNDDEEEPSAEEQFPLVDIPDDQLSEDQIKEKRKQRLMKANRDARERAKEIKREEEEQAARLEREQIEWRERDLEGWSKLKREEIGDAINRIKDRQKLLELFKDRKSAAAQERMKNIATLAHDQSGLTSAQLRKRRKNANSTIDNDPNDTFGANDDDWSVYRDVTNLLIEEEQKKDYEIIDSLEAELLEFDPTFLHEDTYAARNVFDWKSLVLHKFMYGPRELIAVQLLKEKIAVEDMENHPEVIKRNHQLHLNVERIRVPEVFFQPSIAGIDQAGITHLSEDLLFRRLEGGFSSEALQQLIQDVFLTGGIVKLPNFTERIRQEFVSFLPVGSPLKVRSAKDPITDAWKGMAKWAKTAESKQSYVLKAEYEEMGAEYIKEHNLGNVCLR